MYYKKVTGIALLVVLVLITILQPAYAIDTRPQPLAQFIVPVGAPGSHSDAMGGSPITITLYLTYKGASTAVNVYIPGSDAYIAVASAIFGIYEDSLGKWVTFTPSKSISQKSHSGLGCDILVISNRPSETFNIVEYSSKYVITHEIRIDGYFDKYGLLCQDTQKPFNLWASASAVIYK